MNITVQKYIYMFCMGILIIGGLNWGSVGIFRVNFVDKIAGPIGLTRPIFILVGLCAIGVMFSRDFYLPFLGQAVVPCGAIKEKVPEGATVGMTVRIRPGQKVLYWASEPATEKLKKIKRWDEAYLGFENAGVTVADEKGVAVLRVRNPQTYTVPMKGQLQPHIHYRVCMGGGFIGRIETLYLDQKGVNGEDKLHVLG
jgi:uncharacterized membrane protein YuzA (DUF378 family)